MDGNGETWSRGVGLGTLNSFNHILEQGVCGRIAIAILNVVETEGTQVEFDCRVLDGAGEVSAKVAEGERGRRKWADVIHGAELLVAVDAGLIGASGGRSDAKELQVV